MRMILCFPSIQVLFFLKKIKISNFGGISKFHQFIVFGQIWAVLSSFGNIWAHFAALTVAESMPKARLKSLKSSNSSTVNPNATWSGSFGSYHPYLLNKFEKNPKFIAFTSACLKSLKSILATLVL
jgi:hypothetical protein